MGEGAERRARLWHIDECIHNKINGGVKKKPVLDEIDGEYDVNSDKHVEMKKRVA